MNHKPRVLVSLSPHLKEKVEMLSEKYGCSQTEIVRMALIRYLEGTE